VLHIKAGTIATINYTKVGALTNLYKKAVRALNMTVNETYLWTDSAIVLAWIQGSSNKWKTFVGKGFALIQEETAAAIWWHVPSQSNPADLISRGVEPTTLSTSILGEGSTMAYTAAIQVAQNRGHHPYRQLGN